MLYLKFSRKPKPVPYPGLALMGSLPHTHTKKFLPAVLLALACLLLVAAAARPRVPQGEEERKILGVDVALALDVSGSMRAEDLKPSRMEAAKERVKEFVTGFRQGRLALVAFAGRSFTQCPLTADGGILLGLLDQLDVGSVAIDGTAIGDAIINCLAKFKEGAVSRVIILLTDGENNAGVDPLSAARAAATKGVRIYAIGVGTPGGAPVPAYNASGGKSYLKDENGNIVLAKVDEDTLQQVARITGGQYFRARDENALKDVYAKIALLEKKQITIKRIKGYRELFMYPAGAAVLLMLLGGALGAGRLRVLS